jgi:hypothetical protein
MSDQDSPATASELYFPPFRSVRMIERRDFMELVPVCAYRQFFGYGTIKASEAEKNAMGLSKVFFQTCAPDDDVWVAMEWVRFEDGHEETGRACYMLPPVTEEKALETMNQMIEFHGWTKKRLQGLAGCLAGGDAKADAEAYIESRHPNFQSPPTGPNSTAALDVYQARLKVLAGLQPKTVELLRRVDAGKDPAERGKLEREAVQAYFAELAGEWTEDEVLAWQRNNPVGTAWMCELARVMAEPEREIDPVSRELAFNWLRRKYNLLTAAELSDAILVATGQRVGSGTLKKRRERLGLTTDRSPGPRPSPETKSTD